MNKKILIYMPFANWVPHLATDLDIAAKHIDAGDEVFIIQCSGELSTCEPNPTHKKSICKQCISSCKKGLDILDIPEDHRLEIKIPTNVIFHLNPFSDINELKQYKYQHADIGMGVTSSLISMIREPQPDLKLFEKYIQKSLIMSVGVYNTIEHNLKTINPNIFYLFNGRFAPLRPALRAAQHANVKTYTHERNANNMNEYWLCEDTYLHDLEYQKQQIEKCWNTNNSKIAKNTKEVKKQIAIEWFIKQKTKKDTGWYSFTKTQKKNLLPKYINTEKYNIIIFGSSDDEYAGIQGHENPLYKNETEGIKQILDSNIYDDTTIYLKIHPNLNGINNSQTKEIDKIITDYPYITVIPSDSNIDSYALLHAADKIITFGSTMGIEAVYSGIPSILVGRSFFEHLGCFVPKSHKELIDMINDKNLKLSPEQISNSYKYGYWQSRLGTPFKYYKPYSIRGGTFKGIQLGNPIFDNLKDKFIESKLSYPIIRLIKQNRIKRWS